MNKGEFVTIRGPSGSGKSTLLQILDCLDNASSGKYWIDGKDVTKLSDDELLQIRNRKIGFVFQSFNLLPKINVYDNVISLTGEISTIYPGLSVNTEIVTEEKSDVIQVPFVAIQRKEDGQFVQVKGEDETITERKNETGMQSINNVEIVSGLEEGEVIVY